MRSQEGVSKIIITTLILVGILIVAGLGFYYRSNDNIREIVEKTINDKNSEDIGLVSAQETVEDMFGKPHQFSISYLPQNFIEEPSLIRSDVWFYPEQSLKITFIGSNIAEVEEYLEETSFSATELNPWDFYFDIEKEELINIFGTENIETVDYLPGFYEKGVLETYLTDKAIFVFEHNKLTFIETFGLGGEVKEISDEEFERGLMSILSIKKAHAKIRIKNALRCFGKACKFVISLPDKATRWMGPVFGPIASTILTNNIAKHKNLSKIFGRAKRINRIIKDVEEQKKLVGEVQGFYKQAAIEMEKSANDIRDSRKEMLEKVTSGEVSLEDYKKHVMDLEEVAQSFEEGANNFRQKSQKITLENITKMLGKNLVSKIFGQAKQIVMKNVGRELFKLINPNILNSLVAQNEIGANKIIDLLISGDLETIFKNKDLKGIDGEELKKRIREDIKRMLKDNKEDLKKNWKKKIKEIADNKLAELKEEGEEYAKIEDEYLKENDGTNNEEEVEDVFETKKEPEVKKEPELKDSGMSTEDCTNKATACGISCNKICEEKKGEYCDKYDYSGCALDVFCWCNVCNIYDTKWCPNYAGYIGCAEGVKGKYKSCIENCQSKRESGGDVSTCWQDCNKEFNDTIIECKQAPCKEFCNNDGFNNGEWANYTQEYGWDSCYCSD